jgi:chromosome segregation ATPase
VVGVTDPESGARENGRDTSGENPGENGSRSTIEGLDARLEALSRQVSSLREQLDDEREQRAELEDRLAARDERIHDLEAEVARLDARTDILEVVETADKMTGKQRAVTLVQHLHRVAKARERRDEPAAAAVDRNEAEEALHFPDIDRTTVYRDMERAARLVDGRVLRYENGELVLDLETGDLPRRFTSEHGGENL